MTYCRTHDSVHWHCESCGDEDGPFRTAPDGTLLCERCLDREPVEAVA